MKLSSVTVTLRECTESTTLYTPLRWLNFNKYFPTPSRRSDRTLPNAGDKNTKGRGVSVIFHDSFYSEK